MQLTPTLKTEIRTAIVANLKLKLKQDVRYTNSRHANWLGINPSIYSRLSKGEVEKVLSESEWIRVGRKLHVSMDGLAWKVAHTRTYKVIKTQILACMQQGIGGIFCDDSSLGKTFTAEEVDINYPNVAYVDCSKHRVWSQLLRAICQAFGFESTGRLSDVRQRLVDNVYCLDNAVIVLDEVGDLADSVILNLKGLWNDLETLCGWYIMGANGLRTKLTKKLNWQKVGYEEWFNRLGNRYQSITDGMAHGEKEIFKRKQIESVLRLMAPDAGDERIADMVNDCNGNLRRARVELLKHRRAS